MNERREQFIQHEQELVSDHKVVLSEIDIEQRIQLTQALGAIMSDASEDYICAGWFGNWSASVYDAITTNQTGFISQKYLDAIVPIYKILGYLADYFYDDKGDYYLPYVPDADIEFTMSTHSFDDDPYASVSEES